MQRRQHNVRWTTKTTFVISITTIEGIPMKCGCKSSAGAWLRLIAGAVLAGTSGFAAAEPTTTNDAAVAKVFAAFAQPGQPGCSVGARRDGALVYASAHGLADIA